MNFYDAIIIHSYAKVIKGKALDGQMISEEVEKTNKTEEFEIYKDRAIHYLMTQYPNEVQNYVEIYNKPIWVTEWNLQISKTTGNTLFQSLFVAQYFLEIFSNPELSSIDLTTYHNLGGRDFSGSIFRNNKEQMEIQSTYYPIMMIGKIFANNVVRVEQERNQKLFIYKCYDKNNKEVLTYKLDWENNHFSCIYNNVESLVSMVYKSSNMFDKADNLGVLDFEIHE